jgi:protoheme IX farnesyltransferase
MRVRIATLQTLLPLVLLLPVSVLPVRTGGANMHYWMAALLLGLGFLFYGSRFVLQRSGPAARRLLMASIIYLPALLLLLTLFA